MNNKTHIEYLEHLIKWLDSYDRNLNIYPVEIKVNESMRCAISYALECAKDNEILRKRLNEIRPEDPFHRMGQ